MLSLILRGGNPAKEIRKCFSNGEIKELLELQWWSYNIEKITNNLDYLVGKIVEK